MSQIIQIDIEYTDNGIFYGGNSVYGEFIIEARAPITPREVTIECIGEVRVLRHSVIGNALGCVPPIYEKGYVLRRRVSGTGHVSRHSRISRIPFNFVLVHPCPQSLESGRMGHVRYWCQATVVLSSSKKDKHSVFKSFTVLEEVDLTTKQAPSQPLAVASGQDVLPICRCIAGIGRVNAELTLLKSSYVPGENVTARFTVENNCRLKVRSVHLLLTQTIGKTRKREPQITLVQQPACACCNCITQGYSLIAGRVDYSGINSGDTLVMPKARLHIPALPCSSQGIAGRLENSNQKPAPPVPIAYAIVLIAHMGRGPAKDLMLSQPVLLGSIPYFPDEGDSTISGASHTPSFVESACGVAAVGGTGSRQQIGGSMPSLSSILQFNPTYIYYPTIGLSTTTLDGETPRGVKRRSILKRPAQRPSSAATDITSMTSSWITQSQTSLTTRFETPV